MVVVPELGEVVVDVRAVAMLGVVVVVCGPECFFGTCCFEALLSAELDDAHALGVDCFTNICVEVWISWEGVESAACTAVDDFAFFPGVDTVSGIEIDHGECEEETDAEEAEEHREGVECFVVAESHEEHADEECFDGRDGHRADDIDPEGEVDFECGFDPCLGVVEQHGGEGEEEEYCENPELDLPADDGVAVGVFFVCCGVVVAHDCVSANVCCVFAGRVFNGIGELVDEVQEWEEEDPDEVDKVPVEGGVLDHEVLGWAVGLVLP